MNKLNVLLALLVPMGFCTDVLAQPSSVPSKGNAMMAIEQNAVKPYSKEAFEKASGESGVAAVLFHAEWCPTCRKQSVAYDVTANSAQFKNVTFLKADFDSETVVKTAWGVTQQSTLVVFKGGKEISRSIGETTPDGLAKTVSKGL